MNMTSVIARFGIDRTLSRRVAATSGNDGIADIASATTSTVRCVVQPIDGRTLMTLPEGQRTDELQTVWCNSELKTASDSYDADQLSIDGDTWEVRTVKRWDTLGGYWQAVVAKIGR